ncbi:glycosyltransferase family 2 protein [Lentzea waywayandensis]|uniref:glycosyltransferase family 2 protein n=1 Tax=Lentzea waywayandensis TaxID=84724 RepID=UPI000B876323|nr:hypothetical protein [Lentzea waywayandensis]
MGADRSPIAKSARPFTQMLTATRVVPGSVTVGYLDPGTWSACFGLSYRDLLLADMSGAGRIVGAELRVVAGSGDIPAGRNLICRQFLAAETEWLWMVDSDMGFAPDTVDRLVDMADPVCRPVMGALCFGLKHSEHGPFHAQRYDIQPTLYAHHRHGFQVVLDYPRDRVVQVAATGAACLLIHRNALLTVLDRHGPVWFDPISTEFGTFSEDLSFCLRLADADIEPYVHTGVKTTHHKHGSYLDEQAYDASRRQKIVM